MLSRQGRSGWIVSVATGLAAAMVTATAVAWPADAAVGNGPDGVAQIYPTKAGGQTWFMGSDPRDDPRVDDTEDISRNSDGSWRMGADRSRLSVTTTTWNGDEGDLEDDQGVLAQRGYMFDQNDWRDVEMTGYVRLGDNHDDDNFDWFARSARHTDDNECWGTGYKSAFDYEDGDTSWKKELWHTGGYTDSLPARGGPGSLEGRWVGLKAVMYDVANGVKLEQYIDYGNNNQWTKAYDYVDDGGWDPGNSNPCGGEDDQIITWGGPMASFRWDNATDVDFTKLSVREINPTGSPGPSPTASPTTPPPNGVIDVGVTAVTASGDDGNVPGNTRDGDLATRWSASGDGQWIQYALDHATSVHSVRIAWHQGNQRRSRFDVQVSANSTSWTTVRGNAQSSGTTTALEPVDFANTAATMRFVRIVGHGNEDNAWNSITEVTIQGEPPTTPPPGGGTKDLPVSAVAASGDDGHVPQNTRDGLLTTRWSASGDGQWIRFDLGSAGESVHYLAIAWHLGDDRRSTFDVQVSANTSSWTTVLSRARSSGTTAALETYEFADTASSYRYVRIVGHGNDDNAWNSIAEVKIFGCCSTSGSGYASAATDYDRIRSLLFSTFVVVNDEPNLYDATRDEDIDNYYATVFVRHTTDGRQQELVRYRPKQGGAVVWGWTYERYRVGDNFHTTTRALVQHADVPPGDQQITQDEVFRYNSYGGRIWCWYGRPMLMVTNQLIAAVAGIYLFDVSDRLGVLLQIVHTGVAWTLNRVYNGALPEHDYCTEQGYIT